MNEPIPEQDAVQVQKVAAITIAEYDRVAVAYRHGTADHDVSQNIAALLEAIEAICAGSPRSATRRSAWTARASSPPWRAPRLIVKWCTKTSSRSTCHPSASTGSSQVPRCSTYRAASSLPAVRRAWPYRPRAGAAVEGLVDFALAADELPHAAEYLVALVGEYLRIGINPIVGKARRRHLRRASEVSATS